MKPIALSQKSTKDFSLHNSLQHIEKNKTLVQLAAWLSEMTDEHISPRTLLHLLHAQLALIVALLPMAAPAWWHVAATLWAVKALHGGYRSWQTSSKPHTNSSPKRI